MRQYRINILWAEMVMGRNGYGPKWSWAEMVMGRNDPESPDLITLLMCFISFGSISGSINASNGTIFDVYLFSDCLNENLLFSQNDSNPFQIS